MKILGLIPARAGSKGVPGKNLEPLLGKSLVQRAFECSTAASVLDRIVLSTDSLEIATEAERLGIEVPFLRPVDLALDITPMIDVVIYTLAKLHELAYSPDAVLLLQPTSPLRRPEHIQEAIRLLQENDSVTSVVPLPRELCPHYVMKIREDGYLDHFLPEGVRYTRRQDVPLAYRRDGTIFLTRTEILLDQRSFYGNRCIPMVIDPKYSLSIDNFTDWNEAIQRLMTTEDESSPNSIICYH